MRRVSRSGRGVQWTHSFVQERGPARAKRDGERHCEGRAHAVGEAALAVVLRGPLVHAGQHLHGQDYNRAGK